MLQVQDDARVLSAGEEAFPGHATQDELFSALNVFSEHERQALSPTAADRFWKNPAAHGWHSWEVSTGS